MAKKTQKIQKPEISDAEKERLEILHAADMVKGEQLMISPDGTFGTAPEIKDLLPDMSDNPPHKHELYYRGIMKLLRTHLPKGNNQKKAREFVYEEKNVFLTRGFRKNRRGYRLADSRMTYLSDAKELLDVIIKWASNKDNSFNLYITLKDLNNSKGYK
ncbi:MAG: hypothetical protein SGI89_12850 [bacterium]|nr:hypothetical protein [bacterium]